MKKTAISILCVVVGLILLLAGSVLLNVKNIPESAENETKSTHRGHYRIDTLNMYSTIAGRFSCTNRGGLIYYDAAEGGVVVEGDGRNVTIPASCSIFYGICASDEYVYFSTDQGLYQYDRKGNQIAVNETYKACGYIRLCGDYLFLMMDNARFIGIFSAENISQNIDLDVVRNGFVLTDSRHLVIDEVPLSSDSNDSGELECYIKQYQYENCTITLVTKEDDVLELKQSDSEGGLIEIIHGYDYYNIGIRVADEGDSFEVTEPDYYGESSWFLSKKENGFIYTGRDPSSIVFFSSTGSTLLKLSESFDATESNAWTLAGAQLTDRIFLLSGKKYDDAYLYDDYFGIASGFYDKHNSDYFCMIDLEKESLSKEKAFDCFDLVIYADEEEYIIYNEYCLKYYDMKTDTLLKTESLPEFKHYCTYTFEKCGDKILLFEQEGADPYAMGGFEAGFNAVIETNCSTPALLQVLDLYP